MQREHFLVENEHLHSLAEAHMERLTNALDARNEFAEKYEADGVRNFQVLTFVNDQPTILSTAALRFIGRMPEGFASSERHDGHAVPDVSTELGRKIAEEMSKLPPIPLPVELAEELNFGSVIKFRPNGSGATIGVEMVDYNAILSIPVFENHEIEVNPSLAWEAPKSGISKIHNEDYREMKALDVERHSKKSSRLQM